MTNEEKFFISHTHDKCRECVNRNMLTATGFLDLHEQSLAAAESYDCSTRFFGGFEDCERKMLCFLPDYDVLDEDFGISVLFVRASARAALTHRDYLGALMSLGIKRGNIGDIIVGNDGAQIIIKDEIANFLLSNLSKAGHTALEAELKPISELKTEDIKFKEFSKTVASLRIDCAVSAIFNVSRTQSSEAVSSGLIFVNGREISKASFEIAKGDKITFRRKGKAVVEDCGKMTKKGRTVISGKMYI